MEKSILIIYISQYDKKLQTLEDLEKTLETNTAKCDNFKKKAYEIINHPFIFFKVQKLLNELSAESIEEYEMRKCLESMLTLCKICEEIIKIEIPELFTNADNILIIMRGIIYLYIINFKVRPLKFNQIIIKKEREYKSKNKNKISEELRKDIEEIIFNKYIQTNILLVLLLKLKDVIFAIVLFHSNFMMNILKSAKRSLY